MSWPTVPNTKVARVVGGATPKTDNPDFWDGRIDWATPKDLSDLGGILISSTPRKITDAGLRGCAAEVLPAGSVLFIKFDTKRSLRLEIFVRSSAA